MRNPFRFFSELFQQPLWVTVWVFWLMLVNVASLLYWSEPLAKIIFVTFMLSAMLMMGLYSKFGFEKILGLGHVLWIPLLAYLLIEFPTASHDFINYLTAVPLRTFILAGRLPVARLHRDLLFLGHEYKCHYDIVILTEAQRSGRILSAVSCGVQDLSIPLPLQSR